MIAPYDIGITRRYTGRQFRCAPLPPVSLVVRRLRTQWTQTPMKFKERHRHSDSRPSAFGICQQSRHSGFTSPRYATSCHAVSRVGGGSISRTAQAFSAPTVMASGISPRLFPLRTSGSGLSQRILFHPSIQFGRPAFATFRQSSASATVSSSTSSSSSSIGSCARTITTW